MSYMLEQLISPCIYIYTYLYTYICIYSFPSVTVPGENDMTQKVLCEAYKQIRNFKEKEKRFNSTAVFKVFLFGDLRLVQNIDVLWRSLYYALP